MIDSGSEVNAIILAYAAKLDLKTCHTNVRAKKIDGFIFQIFEIFLASFQVENELGKTRFFQKTFLLANISVKMLLGMPFFTFSSRKALFAEKELT